MVYPWNDNAEWVWLIKVGVAPHIDTFVLGEIVIESSEVLSRTVEIR